MGSQRSLFSHSCARADPKNKEQLQFVKLTTEQAFRIQKEGHRWKCSEKNTHRVKQVIQNL